MTARRIALWFSACFLVAASARAQGIAPDAFVDTMGDRDMQFFSPVDFDLDGQAIQQDSGYFFHYSKLSWNTEGERTTLGSPGLVVPAEQVYRQNLQDEGVEPAPYLVANGIQNSPPRSRFAYGDRYEVGMFDGSNGWLIGVLDGPTATSTQTYGFGLLGGILNTYNLGVSNTSGIAPGYTDAPGPDANGDGIGDGNGTQNDGHALGFGSVPVNFEAPAGFFLGFRDYLQNITNAASGTQTGPTLYVGNTGYTADTLDPNDFTNITTITDDIDGDGTPGAEIVFIDVDGNGVFDPGTDIFGGVLTDFGDLHNFNVFFDSVFVRNQTQSSGVEIMRTHDLSNKHLYAKEQNTHFTVGYGVRYLQIDDRFFFQGEGSILGRTSIDQRIRNNIVGPQVSLRWSRQRNRINFSADGRALLGFNASNWDQVGLFGQELVPGAQNRPLYGRPTATAYGIRADDFSPVAEMRLEGRYSLTSALAFKLGYTAMFSENIHRAAQVVRWRAPDWGIVDDGSQHVLINGVDVGFEAVF